MNNSTANFELTAGGIAVYSDVGVAAASLEQLLAYLERLFPARLIATVCAHDIRQGVLNNTPSLFVMPGGRDRFYLEALGSQGNAEIRHYVQNGGNYLGICGGAYYASSSIAFAVGTPLEIVEERPLKFHIGKAVGPLFGKEAFAYSGQDQVADDGAVAVPIRCGKDSFLAYYNGGCYFSDFGPECHPMADYGPLHADRPAVVLCHAGNGKALLMGVHPEWGNEGEASGQIGRFAPLLKSQAVRQNCFDRLILQLVAKE